MVHLLGLKWRNSAIFSEMRRCPRFYLSYTEHRQNGLTYYSGNHKCQYCHSRESGNPEQDWMPDQVRHDNL